MEERAEVLRWALDQYFAQRALEAREARALLDERVVERAVQAVERRRDEVLSGGRLTPGEALDLAVSIRRWCPPDQLATQHSVVVAALRDDGFDL